MFGNDATYDLKNRTNLKSARFKNEHRYTLLFYHNHGVFPNRLTAFFNKVLDFGYFPNNQP